MEPNLPAPGQGPERGVNQPQELPRPEAQVQSAPETASSERPAQQEMRQGPAQGGGSFPVPVSLPPTPAAKPVLNPLPVTDDNPLVASDEEVIEKEWVDKAKKVVAQTKDDPYLQEKEVSKLQADYLKKRYGKEVKISND